MATDRERAAVTDLLSAIDNPCIVELGASTGEEERWFRDAAKGVLHHILVEPDIRNARILLDRPTGTDRRVIVAAISDQNGTAEFHFSDNDRDQNHASGSLRKPTGHLERLPWITFSASGLVQTITLDTLAEQEKLNTVDLLWVDIQGAERNMLLGGQKTLRRTRYIFMEAEEVELYEGQALKQELIDMLPGWSLITDFGENILLRNDRFEGESVSESRVVRVAEPLAKQARPMHLVGLMPVRNEDWCLDLTLQAALAWCDSVVVLDHASTDRTPAIIGRVSKEHPGRVLTLIEESPDWDEMRHRQRMLEAARSIGATHIALIDADEILSAPMRDHVREFIAKLPDLAVMQVPWIILRGSFHRFHSNGMWGNRWVSFAFKDSPAFSWQGDQFHHREPFGPISGMVRLGNHTDGGVIHLWGVSERRLRAKHALYKITERIRWPEKNVQLIEGYYNLWRAAQAGELWEFLNVPADWWAGYDLSGVKECGESPWQEAECQRLLDQHGAGTFAGLDLFGVLSVGPRAITKGLDFSLCHATARFPQWKSAADAWFATADHPERVQYLLAVHASDEDKVSTAELPAFAGAGIVVNRARSCSVDNWNAASRIASGRILINVADDWFPCPHWDTKLIELLPDLNAPAAIDVDTGSHHNLIPFSIITRAYFERLRADYGYGGFFYPEYTSMYSDEEFTWIARHDNVVISAWQHFFEHRHPVLGKAQIDDVYRKQNAPEHYTEGKKLMDARLREIGISPVLVQAPSQRKKLLVCAPGETFSRLWVAHWTTLITTLEKHFEMDSDGQPGVGSLFSYSTNVYVTRSSILHEILKTPLKPDYVLWIDDDNLVTPDKVLQLAQDLQNDSALDAVAGWCFLERGEGVCISAGNFDATDQIEFMTYGQLCSNRDPVCRVDGTGFPVILMRYRLLERVGHEAFYPRFSRHYRWGFSGEDIAFCLRAREVGARLAVDRRVEVPHLKLGVFRPITSSEKISENQEKTA